MNVCFPCMYMANKNEPKYFSLENVTRTIQLAVNGIISSLFSEEVLLLEEKEDNNYEQQQ